MGLNQTVDLIGIVDLSGMWGRYGSKDRCQNDMCLEIGLCAKNVLIILGSIMNIIWGAPILPLMEHEHIYFDDERCPYELWVLWGNAYGDDMALLIISHKLWWCCTRCGWRQKRVQITHLIYQFEGRWKQITAEHDFLTFTNQYLETSMFKMKTCACLCIRTHVYYKISPVYTQIFWSVAH